MESQVGIYAGVGVINMIGQLITDLWFLWILVVIALGCSLLRPMLKGAVGEKTTADILAMLDPARYKVMNDVFLGVGGKTSQIDHVVVSDFGIFVIETKNYKGRISGDDNLEYWIQAFWGKKEKLYSPLRQNYSHTLALKHHLKNFPKVKYIPIIVFSARAELKVKTTADVVYSMNLLKTIRKYTEVNLTKQDKDAIIEKINLVHIKSKDACQKQGDFIKQQKAKI